MTSPSSVITDAEAKAIAQREVDADIAGPESAVGRFAATGEIDADFARVMREGYYMAPPEFSAELQAYVAFHGERGPVDGWGDLKDGDS